MNYFRKLYKDFRTLPKNKQATLAYGVSTVTYGMVRKAIHLHGATITHVEYNDNHKRVEKKIPVLAADKLWITALSGLASIYLWPMYAMGDLKRAEIYMRGLKPSDYDVSQDKKYTADYLFAW